MDTSHAHQDNTEHPATTRCIVTDLVEILEEHSKAVLQHLQECLFAGELVFMKKVRVGLVSTCMYRCSIGPLCPFVLQINTRSVGGFGRSHQGGSVNEDFLRGALPTGIGVSQSQELSAI